MDRDTWYTVQALHGPRSPAQRLPQRRHWRGTRAAAPSPPMGTVPPPCSQTAKMVVVEVQVVHVQLVLRSLRRLHLMGRPCGDGLVG